MSWITIHALNGFLAKGIAGGLPMGACLANEKCAGVLDKGSHGSTFGGNPVCCAGGLAVLNTITADGFLAEVQRKAKLLREKLEKLDGVESVSGLGLMIGIALKDKKAIDVANAALEKGLLVLTAKTKVRLLPPLTIKARLTALHAICLQIFSFMQCFLNGGVRL